MDSKNNRKIFGIFLVCLLIFSSGCYYEKIPIEPPPDPNVDVSYSQDIQTYFDAKCVGCHMTGTGVPLNLEAEVSYANLFIGNYVDTLNPESSVLYVKISPGQSMAQYASDKDRQNTLLWIEQGAKNN